MEIVLGLLAVLVVSGLVAAFIAARPRRRDAELEPPPAAPLPPPTASGAPPAPKKDKPKRPSIPSEEELARQAAEVVAEAEAVLAGAREAPVAEAEPAEAPPAPVKPRFRDRLGKARGLLAGYLGSVRSRTKIDDETWEELEEALIRADVGITATTALLDQLRAQVKAENIQTSELLVDALKDNLKKRLSIADRTLRIEPGMPNVWLFVGVNGVGKTTTIGKVGHLQIGEGRTVDHGRRRHLPGRRRRAAGAVVQAGRRHPGAGQRGRRPGAVVFDAVERAAARQTDLVLADTAGRLHTKVNLMEELKKVRRVADKPPGKVTEVLLVIDATTGQNGLVQAKQFTEAVEVTGVVLTKLDGTAKGGIVLAIQNDLGIPIKLVGLGETAEDLIPFDPDEFIDALFA